MLSTLQTIIGNTIDSAGAKYGNLLKTLQDCYDVVSNNREELHPTDVSNLDEESGIEEPARAARRSEYNIDPELDNID